MEINIDKIKPYPKNAKKHPKKQIEQVANSIKEFGFNQPIVVDKNNEIIVGHGRYEAAKLLGLKKVPILAVDLNEQQAKSYRIADNKLNESDWDMDLVIEELKGLEEKYLDLTGFDKDLIIEPDEKDDEVPEVPEEPKSKLGEIYQLGNHRVMCGDSTKIDDVEKLMDGKKADMVFTSPPYSDMREYGGGKDLSVENIIKFIDVFSGYVDFQVINLGIQRKDGEINEYWNEYIKTARSAGYKFLSWNIWNRETAKTIAQQKAFFPIAHEWIFVFGKENKKINKIKLKSEATLKDKRTIKGKRQKDGSIKYSGVGDISNNLTEVSTVFTLQPNLGEKSRNLHPATFPVELAEKHIRSITNKEDVTIDPFLGSGSTLIACEKTNRICYGLELDCKYVDVIIQRYVDYTGNEEIIKNGEKIIWPKKGNA